MLQTMFGTFGFLFASAFLISASTAIADDYQENFRFNGNQLRIIVRDTVALVGGFCSCMSSLAIAAEGFLKMVTQ